MPPWLFQGSTAEVSFRVGKIKILTKTDVGRVAMNKEDVTNTVMELINSSLVEPVSIKPGDRLVEDLQLDSIGFVELGTGLEQKYLVDISDEDLQKCKTVEQVVNAVLTSPTYETA